ELDPRLDGLAAKIERSDKDPELTGVLFIAESADGDNADVVRVLRPRLAGRMELETEIAQGEIRHVRKAAVGIQVHVGRNAFRGDVSAFLAWLDVRRPRGGVVGGSAWVRQARRQAERFFDACRPLRLLDALERGTELPFIIGERLLDLRVGIELDDHA